MSVRKCTIFYETQGPIVNTMPVIEEEIVFFRKYRYQSKRNNNARRSVCYGAINPNIDPDDLHEATPLLLESRLNNLVTPPTDLYKRVGLIFVYLGLCTMLPWNFLLSVTSFWNYKFRNVSCPEDIPVPSDLNLVNHTLFSISSNDSPVFPTLIPVIKPTEMQLSFPSYVAIASNIPGAITTLLHSFYGQRVSVSTRITWAITILLVSFVSLTVLSIPDSDRWQQKFLHAVILTIVASNVGVNVMQGAMFGVSGRFPPLYAGCVMMGQALGGVLPAAATVLMISFDVEPKTLGPACFGAVDILLVVAFMLERWLSKNKFFLYYAEGKGNIMTGDTSDHDREVDELCYRDIFKRSWVYLLGGWMIYGVTLSLMPALTTIVESVNRSKWSEKYFTPVLCVLLFNVSDLTGRTLSTMIQLPGRSKTGQAMYLAMQLLRLSFIPLFMYCNAAPDLRTLPVVFHSDAVFCCLVVLLGLSVGYIGNLTLIHAPKTSDDAESQEATSLLLTSCFVLGQATGSFGSYFLMKSL